MPISDVASLVGGAALGAPVSEIFKLVIEEAKKVKDFKPLSQDLASTMESLVPVFKAIDSMQEGSNPCKDELKVLIKTMLRAEEMVRKCSRVQWYNIVTKALYTREIKGINQDFFRFCQINLQLIQHKNHYQTMRSMASVSTKIDLFSDTGKKFSELSTVPQPETVTIFWLIRALMELKKKLFEDKVFTLVVSAPSSCGKTMLVTKLCHDVDVKGKFKQIFFITVSKSPNVRLTVQRLLEHTGCQSNEIANNLDASLCIQQLLKKLGQSGSILLVLDDVWPEEESLLEKFLIQLPNYKILVTSRFEFPSFGPTFHLEPLIDEDVKNLFSECTPEPNCQSCAKHNHYLQKILKRCNGLPLAMDLSRSMCGGCNSEIEHGRSVDVLGVLWHPECLWCDACHKPIAIHEAENHVSNSRGKFHKSCYKEHMRRNCYVCKEKIPRNAEGIRCCYIHPFWMEKYCPSHEVDGTPTCDSCQRLEPWGTNYKMLCDGRLLCQECMESAVMDIVEGHSLDFDIREFFEGLDMKIEQDFPFVLVEKQALNKAEEKEKIDCKYELVTRAICMSEAQTVTSVTKGPRMGPNKQLTGMATESQRVVSECEVTAILILYGLPRLLTGYILAHEMMHAYLRLNGHRILNKVLEEGICQVLGHMWLESQTYAPIDTAAASSASASSSRTPPAAASESKKGECSDFEKKLVEFCKNQIETDDSPVFGVGFKIVNQMVSNSSLQETLKEIIRRG